MIENKLTLIINNQAKVEIRFEMPLSKLHCCVWGVILLIVNNQKIALTRNTLAEDLNVAKILLSKVIENNLLLNDLISASIGCIYNQQVHGLSDPLYKPSKNPEKWITDDYLLFSGIPPKIPVCTWLYNNKDGSIIFEVTAVYPYHSVEPEKISYQDWLKTQTESQTIYKTVLSQEVAQTWLEQIQDVLKIIELNSLPPD